MKGLLSKEELCGGEVSLIKGDRINGFHVYSLRISERRGGSCSVHARCDKVRGSFMRNELFFGDYLESVHFSWKIVSPFIVEGYRDMGPIFDDIISGRWFGHIQVSKLSLFKDDCLWIRTNFRNPERMVLADSLRKMSESLPSGSAFEVECTDNTDLENFFDDGGLYLAETKSFSSLFVWDKFGKKRVCFKYRFSRA